MKTVHEVQNCRKCFCLRIAAILIWSSGLVVLSLFPNVNALILIDGQDKFLHLIAYLFNAWLACRSLQMFKLGTVKVIFISITYSIILGGALELVQQAVSTRQAEWLDFLANVIGATIGCAIFCLQVILNSRHHDS